MSIYNVSYTYGNFQIDMHRSQPAEPIFTRETPRDEWDVTPFQTASAGHDPECAAELVLDYLGNSCGEDFGNVIDVDEHEPEGDLVSRGTVWHYD